MQTMTSPSSTADREIVTTRLIDAPRALVFEAWTDPKHVAHWFGPDGFVDHDALDGRAARRRLAVHDARPRRDRLAERRHLRAGRRPRAAGLPARRRQGARHVPRHRDVRRRGRQDRADDARRVQDGRGEGVRRPRARGGRGRAADDRAARRSTSERWPGPARIEKSSDGVSISAGLVRRDSRARESAPAEWTGRPAPNRSIEETRRCRDS